MADSPRFRSRTGQEELSAIIVLLSYIRTFSHEILALALALQKYSPGFNHL